jgi:hypothetical protein
MNSKLKQAMRDAGICVSDGDTLAQSDLQLARDFLYFRGIELHEHFERYETMFGDAEPAPQPDQNPVDTSVIVPPEAPTTDFGVQTPPQEPESNSEPESDEDQAQDQGEVEDQAQDQGEVEDQAQDQGEVEEQTSPAEAVEKSSEDQPSTPEGE